LLQFLKLWGFIEKMFVQKKYFTCPLSWFIIMVHTRQPIKTTTKNPTWTAREPKSVQDIPLDRFVWGALAVTGWMPASVFKSTGISVTTAQTLDTDIIVFAATGGFCCHGTPQYNTMEGNNLLQVTLENPFLF
jgi:hypothetical protein